MNLNSGRKQECSCCCCCCFWRGASRGYCYNCHLTFKVLVIIIRTYAKKLSIEELKLNAITDLEVRLLFLKLPLTWYSVLTVKWGHFTFCFSLDRISS